MLVTDAVFHLLTSTLMAHKRPGSEEAKILLKLEIEAVFHSEIGPYVADDVLGVDVQNWVKFVQLGSAHDHGKAP